MIEAMKQALEALEDVGVLTDREWQAVHKNKAIASLQQAIKKLESQEPVAWQVHPFDYGIGHKGVYARTDRPEQVELWKRKGWNVQPLHTYPPAAQRTWVGLTTDEIAVLHANYPNPQGFALALQAKLKEKNNA